ILEYDHSAGRCAITGGYRYRGSQAPEIYGAYIFGDYCSGQIWAANLNCSGNWVYQQIVNSGFNISTFGEDENGELYVANHPGGAGEIDRLVSTISGNIFTDDFEDNDVSDWHFSKGNWSASGGNLIGTAPRNATAFPNAFTGCAK